MIKTKLMKALDNWQKRFLGAIIFIALGVAFSITRIDSSNSLGIVFMSIGGLLLISGIHLKRKTDQENR